MKAARASAVLLALALGGCVQYAPAPPHPEAFAPAFDARVLPPRQTPWTTADFLALAIQQNPQIVAARAKYVTALAAARAAKAATGPSLTLTAEYATDESPHWGWQAASDIPLDYGVRRSARVTTAQLQALQAFYDYGEAIWSVRTAVTKARADWLAAYEERSLAQQSVKTRDDRAARVQRRVDAGQDAASAALAAKSDAASAYHRSVAAQGNLDAALVALAKALGVSPGALRGLSPVSRLGDAEPSLLNLQAWRRDAAASRRDVLRAVADYDIAEQALRTEVATQYPALSVGPGYFYDHGVNKLPWDLSLALPPWDLNRRAIAQAEAARADAGKSLEAAQASALAEVDAAAVAFHQAWTDLKRTRDRDLPLAARAAGAADRSASAGETDKVDDLAARAALIDVDLALLDAKHAAHGATADLEDALRRPFDPAEAAVIQSALNDAKATPAPVASKGGAR